jgi:hypothetical protein
MEQSTIPIFIDSIKKEPGFKMTRCNFIILHNKDVFEKILCASENPNNILFGFVFDLKVIISKELNELVKIEDLFEQIDERWSWDMSYIWLPNYLFKKAKDDEVYRIELNLFRLAINFKKENITLEEFTDLSKKFQVMESPKETNAFLEWNEKQISLAKDEYKRTMNKKPYMKYLG